MTSKHLKSGNSPVLFNDTYLLNLDEIDSNRISIKKHTMNEHK